VEYTLGATHDEGCVPLVKHLIQKGNTTTYEWIYGEAPLSINEPSLNFNLDDDDDNDNQNNTIDFGMSAIDGIDFNNLDLNGEIDFGNDIQLENAEGAIDWGGVVDDSEPSVSADAIDFDISLEESGIVVEAVGNDGGNASGSQALTILDNPETRNDFIDQLMELEAFLKLRLYEFKSDKDTNLLSMSNMQESSFLQMATLDSTQSMLDNVQIILSEMLDSKVQHLHNIKHSPRYLDVLASNLKQKQKLIKKMESLQQTTQKKQEETRQQAVSLQPTLKLIIQKTKELQAEIESDISKRYKNRKVRLTGGIHTL